MATWKKVIVSGSSISQLDNDAGFIASIGGGIVSGSEQIDINNTSGDLTSLGTVTSGDVSAILPSGTVSGSSQITITESQISDLTHYTDADVKTKLDAEGVISGSSQVDLASVQGDTDDVSEGSTNLYYTDARVKTKLSAEGVISGSSQITITESQISDLTHYTDSDVVVVLNDNSVVSGSATQVKTFLNITESDITDLQDYALNSDLGDYVSGSSDQALATTTALSLSGDTLTLTKGDGTTDTVDLSSYLDEDARAISSGTLNSSTGVVTFTRDDATTFTLDLSALLDDTNLVTSVNGAAGVVTLDTDDVSEGSANLYYTDSRVKTKLNTEGVISGSSQVTISDTTGYTSFSSSIASDIAGIDSSVTLDDATTNGSVTTNAITVGDVTMPAGKLMIGATSSLGYSAHFKSGSAAQLLVETDAPYDGGAGNTAGIRFKVEDTDDDTRAAAGIFYENTDTADWGRGELTLAVGIAQTNSNATRDDWALKVDGRDNRKVTISGSLVIGGTLTGDVTGDLTGTADTASYIAAANIDGSITADSIEYSNILNKPTLVSGSAQIDINSTSGTLTTLGTVTAGDVSAILPAGSVSGSTYSSPSQGTLRATINGVNSDVDLGLQTSDSPTFADLRVTGNLTVEGTRTELQTANLNVEDQFILLNSGSNSGDSGIIFGGSDGTANEGSGIFFDSPANVFGYSQNIASSDTSATHVEKLGNIKILTGAGDANMAAATFQQVGTIAVDNADDIWIQVGA
jgi:hypothetical protein